MHFYLSASELEWRPETSLISELSNGLFGCDYRWSRLVDSAKPNPQRSERCS